SIIQGGYPGTGNLDLDPLFVSQPDFNNAPTTAGDLHITACSPAIDAGTASGAPTNDLDGNARPTNTDFDMGAFEFQESLSTSVTCYADTDGDGFGDADVSQMFCGSCGTGYVADNTDCDDTEIAINTNATEICDGIDNNCNSQKDEGLTFNDWYFDGDGDGFGAGVAMNACQAPSTDYVLQNGDCD